MLMRKQDELVQRGENKQTKCSTGRGENETQMQHIWTGQVVTQAG